MGDRRGRAHGLEVADILEYVPPVREEQKRGDDVVAQLGEHIGREDAREHDGAQKDEYDGGEEPAHAPEPELGQVDLLGGGPFPNEQSCDEVARKDEEDGDAEQSALQRGGVHMVDDDGYDGERAQSVECRYVAGAHRAPPMGFTFRGAVLHGAD